MCRRTHYLQKPFTVTPGPCLLLSLRLVPLVSRNHHCLQQNSPEVSAFLLPHSRLPLLHCSNLFSCSPYVEDFLLSLLSGVSHQQLSVHSSRLHVGRHSQRHTHACALSMFKSHTPSLQLLERATVPKKGPSSPIQTAECNEPDHTYLLCKPAINPLPTKAKPI